MVAAVPMALPRRRAAPGRGTVTVPVFRRRRMVVLALSLGALLAGGWALGVLGGGSLTASEAISPAAARPAAAAQVAAPLVTRPVSRVSHVVAAGDTLWSIARRLQPAGDIRPLVDVLAAARKGRPLQAGESIVLPERPPPGR